MFLIIINFVYFNLYQILGFFCLFYEFVYFNEVVCYDFNIKVILID